MKLQLWQSPAMANNFCHLDALAKRSSKNSKKYAAILIKEFGNRFQDFQKNHLFFLYVCDSTFCLHKYINCEFSNWMFRVTIRYSTQKFDHVFLLGFHKTFVTWEKYPFLHNRGLFMSSLVGSTRICEQLLWRMKQRKSNMPSKISDECFENSLRIPATCVKHRHWGISFTKTNIKYPTSFMFLFNKKYRYFATQIH